LLEALPKNNTALLIGGVNLENTLCDIEPDEGDSFFHGNAPSLFAKHKLRRSAKECERGYPCHHARRKFFELVDVEGAAKRKARGNKASPIYPLALGAVQRIDALFAIERAINGCSAEERRAVRQK
jgi:hypothetical protein